MTWKHRYRWVNEVLCPPPALPHRDAAKLERIEQIKKRLYDLDLISQGRWLELRELIKILEGDEMAIKQETIHGTGKP